MDIIWQQITWCLSSKFDELVCCGAVRGRARGLGGGGGAVSGRRVRGRRRRGAALLRARRPPRGKEGPGRQMAQEQPGTIIYQCLIYSIS